jgi:predicted Rossmann fold nucleotide-binding protein DprA/Smf involved in DNA uptake
MKLAVIGNKEYTDYRQFCNNLNEIKNISMIVSGGAVGTDSMAKKYAVQKGIEFLEFPPDYENCGKEAKHFRNRKIVEHCDRLLAFWNGKCEGTSYTIDYALKLQKPVKIIRVDV